MGKPRNRGRASTELRQRPRRGAIAINSLHSASQSLISCCLRIPSPISSSLPLFSLSLSEHQTPWPSPVCPATLSPAQPPACAPQPQPTRPPASPCGLCLGPAWWCSCGAHPQTRACSPRRCAFLLLAATAGARSADATLSFARRAQQIRTVLAARKLCRSSFSRSLHPQQQTPDTRIAARAVNSLPPAAVNCLPPTEPL